MITILIIIIVLLLGVIYYLYIKNAQAHSTKTDSEKDCKLNKHLIQEKRGVYVEAIEEVIEQQEIDHLSGNELNNEKITKGNAIHLINASIGQNVLSNSNTNFANINKAIPIWWFDVNQNRFLEDLHLILAKNEGFIWLKIPKGTVKDPKKIFYIRADNGLVQLKISSERQNYLKDVSSGEGRFNYKEYVVRAFP